MIINLAKKSHTKIVSYLTNQYEIIYHLIT